MESSLAAAQQSAHQELNAAVAKLRALSVVGSDWGEGLPSEEEEEAAEEGRAEAVAQVRPASARRSCAP